MMVLRLLPACHSKLGLDKVYPYKPEIYSVIVNQPPKAETGIFLDILQPEAVIAKPREEPSPNVILMESGLTAM